MPKLADIARVLEEYGSRFDSLDAFADDVDEIRDRSIGTDAIMVAGGPHPEFRVLTPDALLRVELFPEQGIARFKRDGGIAPKQNDPLAVAFVSGLLGAVIGAASQKKEGLLGGLVLGVLVGQALGAAQKPIERVMALQFDRITGTWQLYDGPLLRWAKRALEPHELTAR